MKITDVKTFLLHPGAGKNLLFVKVETDAGIHGWGEAYTQSDRDKTVIAHIDEMARYLVGRDPMHIRHFRVWAYEDFATKRSAMDFWCAFSGIEIALWDIAGKAMDQPVYNLLGGPVRPHIRLYANSWSGGMSTPDEYAAGAMEVVKSGFTAMKFDPFPGPWRPWVDHAELEEAAAIVGAIREAVGPRVELLVEVHRRLAPMNAIAVGKLIEKYRPYWLEEPVPAHNVAGLREVRDAVNIPVVTGEALYSKDEFRDICVERAVDILNPDICNVGGILEITQIASMAEPFQIAVSPHGWNSVAVGAAAAVQASAVMPNFLIYEYMVHVEPFSRDIMSQSFEVSDGYVELPTAPGLGIDLDETKFEKYAYKQFPARNIRTVEDERKWH
jgi:galactonate dehydratase